jgi:hypothetical protein
VAEPRAEAESERADRAEASRLELESRHEQFVRDADFNRQVLETTTDCIKVLDLDGRLEFMNAGGMRVMEIDDFAAVNMCPWVEFWSSEMTMKWDAERCLRHRPVRLIPPSAKQSKRLVITHSTVRGATLGSTNRGLTVFASLNSLGARVRFYVRLLTLARSAMFLLRAAMPPREGRQWAHCEKA